MTAPIIIETQDKAALLADLAAIQAAAERAGNFASPRIQKRGDWFKATITILHRDDLE